jgi:hypothetical protein
MFENAGPADRYTRADALRDGVLMDVSAAAREAGFLCPVALTWAVWARCVNVPFGVEFQDEASRVWGLLFQLGCAILGGGVPEVRFGVRVRNHDREGTPPLVPLKAVCGHGDQGEPVITVMFLGED